MAREVLKPGRGHLLRSLNVCYLPCYDSPRDCCYMPSYLAYFLFIHPMLFMKALGSATRLWGFIESCSVPNVASCVFAMGWLAWSGGVSIQNVHLLMPSRPVICFMTILYSIYYFGL